MSKIRRIKDVAMVNITTQSFIEIIDDINSIYIELDELEEVLWDDGFKIM